MKHAIRDGFLCRIYQHNDVSRRTVPNDTENRPQ